MAEAVTRTLGGSAAWEGGRASRWAFLGRAKERERDGRERERDEGD
jgi:hypothetical protein